MSGASYPQGPQTTISKRCVKNSIQEKLKNLEHRILALELKEQQLEEEQLKKHNLSKNLTKLLEVRSEDSAN